MKPAPGFQRFHFIGIGGAGMSSLAEVLLGFGFTVSGSDAKESQALVTLRRLGVIAYAGHAASQVGDADVVVFSAAVPRNNPELEEARHRGLLILRRAELLGRLTASHRSLLIAGTHGKSTTTAMLGSIYRHAGLNPTLVGGAAPRGKDVSAAAGKGEILIAEADEFDRAFLSFDPTVAVITNVDVDHLDCYGTEAALHQAFEDFLHRLPPKGLAVLQVADPVLQGLRKRIAARSVTFGVSPDADYSAAKRSVLKDGGESFLMMRQGQALGEIRIGVPGEHNVQNALAAATVALEEGLSFAAVAEGLSVFSGIKRRLEFLGEVGGIAFYDDYGHHPTEVTASLKALRSLRPKRLFLAFQPHLYSRTAQHTQAFAEAVALADQAWVTPIYPAREKPIPGIEGDNIVRAAQALGDGVTYLPEWEKAAKQIASVLTAGDLFVTMGAGDIDKLGPLVQEACR